MTARRRLLLVLGGGTVLTCAIATVLFVPRWIEEERCLRALDGPGWSDAAATLGRLRSERAIPKLFQVLMRYVNTDIETHPAGRALIAIGPPAFRVALANLWQGTGVERNTAFDVLRHLPADSVPMLIAAADHSEVVLRVAVARLLSGFHDDSAAVATHLKLLQDPNPYVRLAAVESVSFSREPPDSFAPALRAILEKAEENGDIRRQAGSVIGCLRPSVAVPVLLAELHSSDPMVRGVAADALGCLDERIPPGHEGERPVLVESRRNAVPRLEELLRDQDEDVRVSALSALDRIGATAACLQPAIELLGSDEGQELAMSVIWQLGPAAASAVGGLVRELERFPGHFLAIQALGRIGPAARAAVPLLHRELADQDSPRALAAQALGRIGPAALGDGALLVELGLRDDPSGCRDGLVLLGTAAVPAVIRALRSEDADLRALAAEYLGGFGPAASQAMPDLSAQLAGDDARAAEKAAWALGRIGPAARSAVPALVALAGQILDGRIGYDLEVVAESFGRIGVKDAPVPVLLRRMARSEGKWFRPQGLLALGRLGVNDDETVKLLRQGLTYDEFPVAYSSAHALLHLGIRDKEVEAALVAAWSFQDWRLDQLRLHAGFPEEVKRILPQIVDSLGEAEESLVTILAQRIAEVGPEARSTLPALNEARVKLLEQGRHWAESPVDSGGSHQKRREIHEAVEAVEAAIASVSGASAVKRLNPDPQPHPDPRW